MPVAKGSHPIPSRTRQLSPSAPMVATTSCYGQSRSVLRTKCLFKKNGRNAVFLFEKLSLTIFKCYKTNMKQSLLAPRDVFENILKYSVIPTFDLVIEYEKRGIILVKRKIAPYKNQWALPGLRMLKTESIDNTLKRIAKQELGLRINSQNRVFIGQFVGKFKTEQDRQDLSTGYLIKVEKQPIKLNESHFSEYQITTKTPSNIGAMYKFYLNQYRKLN